MYGSGYTTQSGGGGAVSFISPDITEVCFVPAANLGDGMVTLFAPNASGETMLAEPPTVLCWWAYFESNAKATSFKAHFSFHASLQLHYSARQLRQCQPHRPAPVHVSHVL